MVRLSDIFCSLVVRCLVNYLIGIFIFFKSSSVETLILFLLVFMVFNCYKFNSLLNRLSGKCLYYMGYLGEVGYSPLLY